jgi:pyrroloquinoline quinone (PQQ) biosynthesis protein C
VHVIADASLAEEHAPREATTYYVDAKVKPASKKTMATVLAAPKSLEAIFPPTLKRCGMKCYLFNTGPVVNKVLPN